MLAKDAIFFRLLQLLLFRDFYIFPRIGLPAPEGDAVIETGRDHLCGDLNGFYEPLFIFNQKGDEFLWVLNGNVRELGIGVGVGKHPQP